MQQSFTIRRAFCTPLLAGLLVLLAGCGDPLTNPDNLSGVLITIVSMNGGQALLSDVVEGGYTKDDAIQVIVKTEPRIPAFDGTPPEFENTSPLDTIVFNQYHVSYSRTDGGLTPGDFSAGFTFSVPPEQETSVEMTVVRAFEKNQSPLKELWERGEIFATLSITLYGEDGYGNNVMISASLPVSFSNFNDDN